MTGIVLSGGKSTRMGSDKGLLKEEEETWAEFAARKFRAMGLPFFVSINSHQLSTYAQIFPGEQLLVDSESFASSAPLFGMLSAHLQLPHEDLFVLACDLKDMTPELMQHLQNEYKKEIREALVYHTGERPQPLCGIYSATGLSRILELYRNGNLKRFSMMYVLEVLDTKYLPVNDQNLSAFNNYNYPDEI